MLELELFQQEAEPKHMNKLDEMSEQELRDLFIEATNVLKSKKIGTTKAAQRIHLEKGIVRMNPKRAINIRSDSVRLIPDVEEVQALFDLYPDELKELREQIGQPSPIELKLQELDERISRQEEYSSQEIQRLMKERARLYQKIAELQEKLKKKKD